MEDSAEVEGEEGLEGAARARRALRNVTMRSGARALVSAILRRLRSAKRMLRRFVALHSW